ncbi:hypothetical protein CF319_g8341 [Tilletia indica]|nr:hypothetical protein CF319_g8341 [Tilletia indica]
MTESVQAMDEAGVRAAMQAELEGVDAIARYRFEEDFNIFEFGQHIDSIPNITTTYTAALRQVAYAFDEPDTRNEAFDTAPSLAFPASQERYRFLQESPSLDQYLNLSQSQSQSLHLSQSISQTSSTGPPLSIPQPNQQHQREQKQQSRDSSTATQQEKTSGPRRSPRREVPRADLQRYVTDMRTRTSPGPSGSSIQPTKDNLFDDDTEDSDPMESPQRQRLKRQRLSGSTQAGKGGDGDYAEAGPSDSRRTTSKLPPQRRFRPTAEAIAEMEKASQIPDDTPISIGRVLGSSKASALHMSSDRSGSALPPPDRSAHSASDGATKTGSTGNEKQNSLKLQASKRMQRPGKMYEGEVLLSGSAQTSKMGMPVPGGYNGFKYFRSWMEDGIKKEQWTCLPCVDAGGEAKPKHYMIKSGHNTNLNAHRDKCPNWPRDTDGKPLIIDDPLDGTLEAREGGVQQVEGSKSGPKSTAVASSAGSTTLGSFYRGPSLSGWISGQQISHPLLTRRLGLVMVVENSLPFSHLKSPGHVAMVKSIDARATKALKSGHTVRRDLDDLYIGLKNNVYTELQSIDTLVSLQHDAWTTRSYQYSFIAMLASYVTSSWDYREILLAFDVVKAKHTGGTFSGHAIRLLDDYSLDEKWYGPVVSDSTGVNHRMLNMLSYDLSRKDMQQRAPYLELDAHDRAAVEKSCSACPRATQRRKGQWEADDNKILCLNHHINLAIRAGFSKMGIKIQNRIRRKVLDIRPGPIIQVTDESGNRIEVDLPDLSDEENEDGAEVVVKARRQGKSLAKGKGKAVENERKDAGQEEESSSDEEPMNSSDCDFEPGMEPDDDELESDDEGGPLGSDAVDTEPSRTSNSPPPQGALGKLEAFVTAIHRGDQRRAAFREQMEKEYHRQPEKASLPFPSKPNGTRWNSHYAMIKGAMKVREAIDAHCRSHLRSKTEKFGQYLLSDVQWRQLELLRPVLRLAAAVTKKMERVEGNLYMVLDHHASLRDEVEELVKGIDDDDDLDVVTARELKAFCKAVADKLRKYRDLALNNRLILAAALLHPLNRLELFETSYPQHQRKAEEALRALLKELVGGSGDSLALTASKDSPPPPPPSPVSAARARRKSGRNTEKQDGPDEVAQYLDIKNCPWRDTDKSPYKWWKDNEAVFPNVAKLARLILGIPGSSSSVERVFSQAALIATNRRARLDSKSISRLVTTKLWLRNGGDKLVGLDPEVRRAAQSIAMLPDFA